MEILHKSNIWIHIIAGSIALVLGIIAILANKGKRFHTQVGKGFLFFLSIVIFTGLFGVFVFGRNSFLLVITLLSGYNGFSGYRVLQSKSNKPQLIDIIASIICLMSVFYFLHYFNTIGMIWQPVIIHSTIGALLAIITYDFIKYFIPASKYKRLWLYEHIYKMIGAFSALLAAFSGTVFKTYQPYSQILPSLIGIFLQIGFIIYFSKKNTKSDNSKIGIVKN